MWSIIWLDCTTDLNPFGFKVTTVKITTKCIFLGIWKDLKSDRVREKGKYHSLRFIK